MKKKIKVTFNQNDKTIYWEFKYVFFEIADNGYLLVKDKDGVVAIFKEFMNVVDIS